MDGRIRAREVRVIDTDGKNLGVMSLRDAISQAHRRGLNLVEVATTAQPPVCRIVDFGKFRYEQSKKERDARKHHHANRLKELEFHVNISDHDYQIKLHHVEDWLRKGFKVKASVTFRGREMAHKELGTTLMERFIKDCAPLASVDSSPRMLGRRLNVMLTPSPAAKRLRASNAPSPKPPPSGPPQTPAVGSPQPQPAS